MAIDVNKPLIVRFRVPRKGKAKVWVEVKYEKIADFCFGCERLGHVVKNCETKEELQRDEIKGKRFGICLKTSL